MSKRILTLLLVLAVALVAACGGDDDGDSSSSSTETTTETPTTEETSTTKSTTEKTTTKKSDSKEKKGSQVKLSSSDFGEILVDGRGHTLYLFTKEEGKGKSDCYDECAEAWPPFLTEGEPSVSGDLDEKMLGTTKRDDGTTQVTYNGHPLYYYVDETEPGQVFCQAVEEFGGIWYVVDAKGDAIT